MRLSLALVTCSAAATCVLLLAPPARARTEAYWVLFRDRGAATAADVAVAAASNLTARALARRAKASRERGEGTIVDTRDLDLDPSFVAAVEATGATIRTRSRWLHAVSVDAGAGALAALRLLPFVSGIRPVEVLKRSDAGAADEFHYGSAEHQLTMLGVPEAHAMGYRGEGVLVCVLDSGFDLGHEAFDQLEVRATRDFLAHDDRVSNEPGEDLPSQSNHGTQVLSIIAGYAPGRIIGPAYRAEYLLGKTERIGSETRVEEDAWIEAIEWAESMGADIVTSSLSYHSWYRDQDGDGTTALISRAANLAFERGLLVFNSIGNYGPRDRSLSPPSDAPGTIAVGATDWNGRLSSFSSKGPTWDGRVKPDLVAMGSGVAQVTARTRDRYGSGRGTSYSTPLVAGCAAIILSAHPEWGPEAVREALLMSADRAASPDHRYGWGIPNVRDAILYPLIEGVVSDRTTRGPVAGARVTWVPAGGDAGAAADTSRAEPGGSPARGTVNTDSTGAYVIPNLPRGAYTLRVEAEGYAGMVSESLEVPPGLGDVNFALEYGGK